MSNKARLLSEAEWRCLESVAGASRAHGGDRHAAISGDTRCGEASVQRLVSLGLIEVVTDQWLPLEKQHKSLRVTAAGRKLLETAPS